MRRLFNGIATTLSVWCTRLLQAILTYPDLIAKAFAGAIALLLLASMDGRAQPLPTHMAYAVSWVLMFALPAFLVWRHRWRQQQTLDRIRGIYAVASEWLMQGRFDEARRALTSIQRLERHWLGVKFFKGLCRDNTS